MFQSWYQYLCRRPVAFSIGVDETYLKIFISDSHKPIIPIATPVHLILHGRSILSIPGLKQYHTPSTKPPKPEVPMPQAKQPQTTTLKYTKSK